MTNQHQTSAQPVTDATFQQDVLDADGPVLVDFWAQWCAPCRALAPILDQLGQEQAGRLSVRKLNIDQNPESAARYGVRSIPTMILFRDGQPVTQLVGVKPKAALLRELEPHLQAA